MRATVALVLAGIAVLGCGGGGGAASQSASLAPSLAPSASPSPETSGEPVEILAEVQVAAEPGSEPIATGVVLEGSALGVSPFCVGGAILDSHASNDPAVAPLGLIDRTFTCSDGTVRLVYTPEVWASQEPPPDMTQKGTWRIVGGTDAYEGLSGSGTMVAVYDIDESKPSHQTLTGTVAR